MTWWRVFVSRCRALLQPQRVRDEIDEEMRFHLEMRERANIRDGMPIDEAQAAATRAFGSVTQLKENSYDIRGGGWLEALARDIGYAVRAVLNQRTLSAVIIGIVAIGVGASAAILGVADRVLWRKLPVTAPGELEHLVGVGQWYSFSIPAYRALRTTTGGAFSGLIARWRQTSTFAVHGDLERRVVEIVSGNYFDVLGIRPGVGRLLSDDDDRVIMGRAVVVISDRYWRTRFGASDSAIGRTILLDDYLFTIVGVAPPNFSGVEVGVAPDAWVPLAMHPVVFDAHRSLADEDWLWLDVIGRRAPGVSSSRAQALATIALQQYVTTAGKENALVQREIRLVSANRGLSQLRGTIKMPLVVLIGIVGFVLAVVCANLAMLVAVRTLARTRELGVRLALGASRMRVIRQLVAENLLLAVVGGALGTVLAIGATRWLVQMLPPAAVPTEIDGAPDTRTLLLSLLLSAITGLLCGMSPAIRAARLDIAHVIREEVGARSRGRRRLGLRRVLVLAQVTGSLVLVIAAGLFAKSLARLAAAPSGLEADHVLMATITPSLNRYTPQSALAFYHALEARLAAVPGARAVGMSASPLLNGPETYNITTLWVRGHKRGDPMSLLVHTVAGDFFGATGTRVLRGRPLNEGDVGPGPIALVLNETAAREYFGDRDPIGQSGLLMGKPAIVVGIVHDSKYRTAREAMPQIVYLTFDQDPSIVGLERTIYVRTDGDPRRFASALESAVHDIDRAMPVNDIRRLTEQQWRSMGSERIVALLSGIAGAITLVLAAVGLYGLVAFDAQRRTREIGVRLALGASRARIVTLVLRGVLGLLVVGSMAGLMVSRAFSTLVASELYGVSAGDVTVAVTACATLLTAALLAACIPAWRAARLNPVEALRSE